MKAVSFNSKVFKTSMEHVNFEGYLSDKALEESDKRFLRTEIKSQTNLKNHHNEEAKVQNQI